MCRCILKKDVAERERQNDSDDTEEDESDKDEGNNVSDAP